MKRDCNPGAVNVEDECLLTVKKRNSGVPATGIKFNGRKMMNSKICRIEKGEYTAETVGLPNIFTGSRASVSNGLEPSSISPSPSLTNTASKTSTNVSSTKKASNSKATIAAPSPRTRKAPLIQASVQPWKMARKATCGM